MKNADMPVIPCEVSEQYFFEQGCVGGGSQIPMVRERRFMATGMTKREEFALKIMAGIYSNSAMIDDLSESSAMVVASASVLAADALLTELERTK